MFIMTLLLLTIHHIKREWKTLQKIFRFLILSNRIRYFLVLFFLAEAQVHKLDISFCVWDLTK